MAETIDGSNEVVFGLSGGIAHNQGIENGIVWIGEENRLDISIVHSNMLHAVFLLVATSQLVFLNVPLLIVISMGTHHETVLGLAIHRLCIYIIMFARVLYQPALILELLEVLSSLLINTWVILRRTLWEIYFGFDDMIQTLFVVACLSTCFFTVKDIIRATFNLFH